MFVQNVVRAIPEGVPALGRRIGRRELGEDKAVGSCVEVTQTGIIGRRRRCALWTGPEQADAVRTELILADPARIAVAAGAKGEVIRIASVDVGDRAVSTEQRVVLVVTAADQERGFLRTRTGHE